MSLPSPTSSQNIPGLDAPSWSRISGNDEQQEEEEEIAAEQIWIQQQAKRQAQGQSVQFTASSVGASDSSDPISCDLLVVACGMMSSAFVSCALMGEAESKDAPAGAMQELGRFTVTDASASASAAPPAPTSKHAQSIGARPHALILARAPGSSTLYALNYLRVGATDYFDLTQALLRRVTPKQVLLLDTLNQGAYISASRPAPCPPVLRRLQSSAFVAAAAASDAAAAAAASAAPVAELEAPNLVHTWSASVLTQCEVSRIPAQLFISLESRHYVAETLQAFEALFPSLFATGLAAAAAPELRASAGAFLTAGEKRRVSAYKSAAARLERVYGYTAGMDSSMRETAAEVQRSSGLDAMFF